MQNIVPKNLEELVLSGKEHLAIELAEDVEMSELKGIVRTKEIRSMISSWSVIKVTAFKRSMYLLSGYTGEGQPWCTSPILAIDRDRARVLTENSIYGLADQHLGEPDLVIRLHIAYLLRSWNIDGQIGHGVQIYTVFH